MFCLIKYKLRFININRLIIYKSHLMIYIMPDNNINHDCLIYKSRAFYNTCYA